MKHSIYIHQNKLNNKIYVGYSSQVEKRWREEHRRAFRKNSPVYDQPLYRAIRRDGWDNFYHIVIEEFVDIQDALDAEKFWVEFFRSNRLIYGNEYGYNLHEGGGLPPNHKGRVKSPEERQKLSDALKGKKIRLGQTNSDEHNKKISEANTGKKRTDEEKERMSKSMKGIKKDGSASAKARTGKSRLFNEEQIKAIFNDPRPYDVIAEEYGCSKMPIRQIKRNQVRLVINGKRVWVDKNSINK